MTRTISEPVRDSALRDPVLGDRGRRLELPGIATAHSHAFQRSLRGRTERRATEASSFWSWRGLMYKLAARLDPDHIHALSRFAYAELAMAGVTAVGEFHYVHHQPDGRPYDDRLALAEAVIAAAREVGIRITLLRVIYERGGHGIALDGAQRRFGDNDLAESLGDVDELRRRHAADPAVEIGIAPHSVRAVRIERIVDAARHARASSLPFHMHIAEQRRELDECRTEHGLSPVSLLADRDVLDERFVAVHATHLAPHEAQSLGEAGAFACICRTTERDLGDGACHVGRLVAAGARLCTGVDSHSISDPFEEARAIELDERTRVEARHAAADAPILLDALTTHGYAAIGMAGKERKDSVHLDPDDPSLVGLDPALESDAVIFGATPRAVREVYVDGERIVEGGVHRAYDQIREGYERALRDILDR